MPFKMSFEQFERRYKAMHKTQLKASGVEVTTHGWQQYAANRIGVSRQVISQWKGSGIISERGLLLIQQDLEREK